MSSTPAPDGARRALLAHLRQEFSAPANAIAGYAEMMVEDADRAGYADAKADLVRILSAAGSLQGLLADLLSGEGGDGLDVAKVRHDLRTPINAIKGYGEMLLEDAADGAYPELIDDLTGVLAAADDMLRRIDELVSFASGGQGAAGDLGAELAGGALGLGSASTLAPLQDMLSPRPPGPGAHAGKILVVDDNGLNRDVIGRRLRREGHEVELAENGTAALAAIAARPFDLVLLDLMMPDITGYDVLTHLKADARTRHIPVIMMSALDAIDSVVRCVEAGALDYLPKPFDTTLLLARIAAALDTKFLRDREQLMLSELERERDRSERLLLSVLPAAVVERIKQGTSLIADLVPEATILFADIDNFTPMAGRLEPSVLVQLLNTVFSAFDRLVDRFGAEKIKTIGDAYMVAVGLPQPRADHAPAAARLARAMLDELPGLSVACGQPLGIRIGLHSGPVVAGVIGERKWAYDVWGDTVNIASRMESHGLAGRIHLSQTTQGLLAGRFAVEPRGPMPIKGAGLMSTFFLGPEQAV
ncbi:adenylate/guanylate cyclase domain-containing protein [Chelatococcus reniformis]|uniref:histidine kinase n=1 Tax=Chelatococcus reniformis TaxID=1494448 RepID=A0A916XLZ2_9HYPH|nr:adenylate/guanylate cyclase domain-containing protein [Chelatococcus reniformis]GGC85539.1 two-component hybrid sensor and regulator [Chelatococcus reniformis]